MSNMTAWMARVKSQASCARWAQSASAKVTNGQRDGRLEKALQAAFEEFGDRSKDNAPCGWSDPLIEMAAEYLSANPEEAGLPSTHTYYEGGDTGGVIEVTITRRPRTDAEERIARAEASPR
jgi:hypothetical protein